jgi:hypothetical protein
VIASNLKEPNPDGGFIPLEKSGQAYSGLRKIKNFCFRNSTQPPTGLKAAVGVAQPFLIRYMCRYYLI